MNVREESIVWSGQEFLLRDFLEKFPLPQIIKVEEGYHDELEEDRTLSASQLLTLHSIQEHVTVKASDQSSMEMLLPADSKSRVEILNRSEGPDFYNTVEGLASTFPRFAATVNKLPLFSLSAGEILELKETKTNGRERFLVCDVVGKSRNVELPFSFKGKFEVLGNCPSTSPTLEDVVKNCKLPCTVKFLDNKLKLLVDGYDSNLPSGLNCSGPVDLHAINRFKVVFATTWEDQKADSVLPLPIDLEIKVVAALGAIQGDKTYAKLCKIAQDKTKSEHLVLRFLRHGPYKVIFNETKAEPEEDVAHSDYSEVGPRLPPKNYPATLGRKPVPVPNKPRSTSAPEVPSQGLPNPTEEIKDYDDAFDDFISVKESGSRRSISLNLDKLPPGCDDETLDFEDNASSPSTLESESQNPLRENSKKVGKFLKKVPSKVGSEVKKLRRSFSRKLTSRDNAEYREVTPVAGGTADRLNQEWLHKVHDNKPTLGLNVKNPHDIKSWSVQDVAEVLRFCNLDAYVEIFQRETIDGVFLSCLNASDLVSLGIDNELHKRKILKIIDGWLPKT